MSVYIVARINIQDRDRYAQYEGEFMSIFSRFNGTMLAVDEAPQVLEGDWPATRTVLISFPNEADARAWYESEAYQAIAQHRFAASEGDIALLQGIPSA